MSTDAWAATLRESVKQIRKGFTVKKGTGAGKVWLSYKPPRTPGVKAATATLPIVWESRCVLDVLNRDVLPPPGAYDSAEDDSD